MRLKPIRRWGSRRPGASMGSTRSTILLNGNSQKHAAAETDVLRHAVFPSLVPPGASPSRAPWQRRCPIDLRCCSSPIRLVHVIPGSMRNFDESGAVIGIEITQYLRSLSMSPFTVDGQLIESLIPRQGFFVVVLFHTRPHFVSIAVRHSRCAKAARFPCT